MDSLDTKTCSPDSGGSSSALWLRIAKFLLKQFRIMKCSFSEIYARQPAMELREKQKRASASLGEPVLDNSLGSLARTKARALCACSRLVKGPPKPLPLQTWGKTLRFCFWPLSPKGTVIQTAGIDIEEIWNTIYIFGVTQDRYMESGVSTITLKGSFVWALC